MVHCTWHDAALRIFLMRKQTGRINPEDEQTYRNECMEKIMWALGE